MHEEISSGLTRVERRATFGLASVYGVRMLGLFMILPVFALYAIGLEGVTPSLVGLAIGIYGLTQAIFQIPLGMLSDRIGRKPVIIMGLLVFAAGSVLAALADSITGVIIGRALQGSGAVAAATLALAADLTRGNRSLESNGGGGADHWRFFFGSDGGGAFAGTVDRCFRYFLAHRVARAGSH